MEMFVCVCLCATCLCEIFRTKRSEIYIPKRSRLCTFRISEIQGWLTRGICYFLNENWIIFVGLWVALMARMSRKVMKKKKRYSASVVSLFTCKLYFNYLFSVCWSLFSFDYSYENAKALREKIMCSNTTAIREQKRNGTRRREVERTGHGKGIKSTQKMFVQYFVHGQSQCITRYNKHGECDQFRRREES